MCLQNVKCMNIYNSGKTFNTNERGISVCFYTSPQFQRCMCFRSMKGTCKKTRTGRMKETKKGDKREQREDREM